MVELVGHCARPCCSQPPPGSRCRRRGASSTPPTTAAQPDLTISWLLTSNVDGFAITCAEAGNADTVTARIDGGGLGTNLTAYRSACPANSDSGSFVALLPTTGTYDITVELTAGSTLLSETPILTKVVDCSGLSANAARRASRQLLTKGADARHLAFPEPADK